MIGISLFGKILVLTPFTRTRIYSFIQLPCFLALALEWLGSRDEFCMYNFGQSARGGTEGEGGELVGGWDRSDFIRQCQIRKGGWKLLIYKLTNMRATTNIFCQIIVVTLIILNCQSTSTCHVLCNCMNSTCISCYNTFQSNSSSTAVAAGTCPCPIGFYSLNNTCYFCKDNCKVCADFNVCIECYTGYTKTNGECINIKYAQQATWVLYEAAKDFQTNPNSSLSTFGFSLFPVGSSISSFSLACPIIATDLLLGFKSSGSTAASLLRIYQGLPFHDWAHITIKYVALDTWNGQKLQTQLYMDAKLVNKTYQNLLRNTNICGDSQPDSIDQIHSEISHQKESLGINFTIPASVTLAIRSIKLDVGTCPRNCLTCSGPATCLQCKSYYILNANGTCSCNANFSQSVSYGCLEKCQPGYVFIPGLQRCALCSLYLPNCNQCQNSLSCQQCNKNTFLHNGGCLIRCPDGYYPKKTADNISSVAHCHLCPVNCTSCFNETVCLKCLSNLYLSQGNCVGSCPFGNSILNGVCYAPTACPAGCSTCNNSMCTSCQLGFWLSGSSCLAECPAATFRSTNRTCVACSANCLQCLDYETCQACNPSFTLRNGTCQQYTTNCNLTGYYYDARVRFCVACPEGCSACFRTLCYLCSEGYYLDNGLCKSNCSPQKYRIIDNITTNNKCYWRNQLCLEQSNTTDGSCNKCRSLDYILALNSDLTCKTYCQPNKTFTTHSPILTQNSRLCTVSCVPNCQICINSVVCIKCTTGYVISAVPATAGTCVSTCGSGYLSDSLQCFKCQYGCNICDMKGDCLSWAQSPSNTSCSNNCSKCIGSICVECPTGLYLNEQGGCLSSCAVGTFKDTVGRQCRKCPPQCQQCVSFSVCSKCIDSFYLLGETCVRECPIGRYPNQQIRACDTCNPNCRTCYGPKPFQCMDCYSGYSKDNSECVPTCPVHKYQDIYGSCDWCHESCRYCFGPAQFQCLECGQSNYLYKGECYAYTCPAATYLAVYSTRECKDCQVGCARCASPYNCQQCFGGFYLNNGACSDVCPLNTYYSWQNGTCVLCSPFCAACISSSCYQCESNYSLYYGSCISTCPNGTFTLDYYYGLQCRACPVQCLTCTTSYQCTSCINGLTLRNGQCITYCQAAYFFNVTSSACEGCPANCVSCSAWGCNECRLGYYQYNGICNQTCPTGTYAVEGTAQCGSCPSTCISCLSFYQCTQCKATYTLTNGVCRRNESCSTNCLQCADANTCILCRPGYYRFATSLGIYCSEACPNSYYLYAGSECVPCQPQCLACVDGIGCTQCRNGLILFMGQCISVCYPGFYFTIINGISRCLPCSVDCQQCVTGATNCTVCRSPTAVFQNGSCVERRQCLLSAFYSESIGYCVPCTAHCKICHNPTQCDQCLPGYYLTEQKQCRISCPNGTYISISNQNPSIQECSTCPYPCLSCLSQDRCSICYPGYALNTTSNQCQSNCNRQTGYFLNAITNTCDQCSERCLQCSATSTNCTSCAAGFYLIGNQCVIQCPQGTFPVISSRSCLPCGQNCQACISQSNCQNCLPNTANLNGTCLPVCPPGYYASTGICYPCVNPCRQCTGGSTYECSVCEQGYYFYNNRCTPNCPDGYYRNQPTASCRVCPTACRTCTSFTSCQTCQSGYTLNTLTQQCETTPSCPSSLPLCQTCRTNPTTNTTQCTSCFNGFYLQAGQCVQQCINSTFENRLAGSCDPCPQNCTVCATADSCTGCNPGFYLFNQRCYQICPNGTYPYVDQSANISVNTCRIDPCTHYLNQQCLSCVAPFILYNGQCVSTCPIGTFRSVLSCQPCRTGCTECVDLLHCTKCLSGFHFYNFQCFDDCPSGTYSYVRPNGTSIDNGIQNDQCLPCSRSCLICTSETQCSKCSSGFYLTTEGRCVTQCPIGYYANYLTGNCEACSRGCAECQSIDRCQRCSNGSYLISGQCTTECPVGTYASMGQCQPCLMYCRMCTNSSNCTQCEAGYLLNRVTNQCVRSCPVGTYVTTQQQCMPCPTVCLSCSTANECNSCRAPAILFNGGCVTQCPSGYTLNTISGSCIECDPYCRECSNVKDNCTSCQQGYQLINGYCRSSCPSHTFLNTATNQCQSCTTTLNNGSCAECYGLAIDQCLECNSPYFLFNNVCVQNCPQGYYGVTVTLRQCLPCDNLCLTCALSSRNCTRCSWGYYLVNSTCVPSCPSRYYANPDPTNYTCLPCISPCVECIDQQRCTVCLPSYYVTPTGFCVTNCSALPVTTNSGYFLNLNTSRCEECPANCLNCTSQTRCTQCQLPTHLYLWSCVHSCPTSTFLNLNTNTCQQCNQTYCTACTSQTECSECLAGVAYLFNGDCVQNCSAGYVVLDGRCVINNDNQSACSWYWLNSTNQSSCVQYCPNGYYPSNSPIKQCLPCAVGCLSCTNSSSCQSCLPPYKLLNNTCINACPIGYVESNSICIKCDDSCRTCSPTPTECTSCEATYYLFNSQCVQVCPDGYYPDSLSKQCRRCADQCLKCTAVTQCTQCKNTRYTPPNCIDTICTSTQYKIQATGQCADCNTNCLTCNGGSSSNCLSCRSPLILISGQCRTVCPLGFVISTANNTCIPCPLNCKNCTYLGASVTPQCNECFDLRILNNNTCLDDCSTIETETQAFTTNGNSCFPCPANCLDCTLISGNASCVICKPGYTLYLGQCTSQCPSGYYPIQGICNRCPVNCSSCTGQSNSCTSCTNGTYLYNGACVQPCPNSTYANAATSNCQPCADLQCVRCSTGINSCEECVAPFSLNLNTRTCTNCTPGYLYNSVTRFCQPCAQECLTCNLLISNCTSCPATTALVDGRCVEQCPSAYYLFLTNTTRECRRCPTNCLTCHISVNSSQCDQCAPGYYRILSSNQCVAQCPSNTFISNTTDCSPCSIQCLTCNSTSCTSCPPSTYFFNGRCLSNCPSGYAPLDGSCSACPVGCTTCSTPTNCTTCRSDYTLTTNRTCEQILPCPAGKYADLNGICQNCSTYCLMCTSLQNCSRCSLPYFLLNGSCSQSCLSNQYSITVSVSNSSSKICVDCLSPCDKCISNTSCTHCLAGYFLNINGSCVSDCGSGYYPQTITVNNFTDRNCTPCNDSKCQNCTKDGCQQCSSGYYLFGLIVSNMTNGSCVADCPSGYFKDNSTSPLSCTRCSFNQCDKCNSTQCFKCLPPYILLISNGSSSCVSQCPIHMFATTTNNITRCQNCMSNCRQCHSLEWCYQCDPGHYLYVLTNLTVGSSVNYNTTCVVECPDRYFELPNLITNNGTCNNCQPYCLNCTNQTHCTECISEAYVLLNNDCVPYKCLNCALCVGEQCQQCVSGFYLFPLDKQCYAVCPDGYWGNPQTGNCQLCMDNCIKCPSRVDCLQCKDGYNFTDGACIDEAFAKYGSLSNMSGFTSNITEITSAVYLATSVGPMVFGQMTTTYFNIQFCQFILFHAKASGNNTEMQQFLASLQSISLTMSSPNNTNQKGKRRLLASSLADPMTFLATSAPIFAMMGGFIAVYILILILEKNANSCCLSCPRLHFYVYEICQFMKKRFKWIYFDFVAWVSYLPFLYFSLMQLQKFQFDTALSGFSCILSMIIVVVYPLYPFFIAYLLKQNYNDLVHENNQLVEMSLSPYVYKVKRPTKQLVPEQAIKEYFTAQNLRLVYDPLKYLRKFIFVLIVAVCHEPITSLVVLIILNLAFIGYMAVFRPRQMPYMVFDFIIEGILLFFQIFMLVYLTNESAKVTAMSIAAHAVGFLTANISLIIAIILNLIAYYKIFMCIYEMVKHLREKLNQKQKGQLKDSEDIQPEHEDFDMPEKQHDLTKSLKKSTRVRNNDDATEFDQSQNNNSTLIKDKQLFGNQNSGVNSSLKRSTGGLPNLKSTKTMKKEKLQFEEQTQDHILQDKELPRRERVQKEQELTESNPDSKISKLESEIFRDKELYKGPSGEIRNSTGQIPDLKASIRKNIKEPIEKSKPTGNNPKLKQATESDEDFMIRSGVQNGEVVAIEGGILKEAGKDKFKRTSFLNPGEVAVTEGIPIAGTDKFRRNLNNLPRIDSVDKQLESEQQGQAQNAKFKQIDRKNKERQNEEQIKEAQLRQIKRKKSGSNQQIEEAKFKNKQKQETKNSKEQDDSGQQYVERKNNRLMSIPVLENQKGNESMNLLEASFVDQSRAKQEKKSDEQDNEDIYNISLNAKSINRQNQGKINGQNNNNKMETNQPELTQAKFQNVVKKNDKKNAVEDFDQFLQQKPKEIDTKYRERQPQNKNANLNSEDADKVGELTTQQRKNNKRDKNYDMKDSSSNQQDLAELATKLRNKAPDAEVSSQKMQKEAVIEGGKLIQNKKDKFRRKVQNTADQIDEEQLNYVGIEAKKAEKNKRGDISQDVEEVEVKERTKKRVYLQNQLSPESPEKTGVDNRNIKRKFEGQIEQSQLGDQFERAKKQKPSGKKKKGLLGIEDQEKAEQYDEICRRNKDNMFSPDKGVLMGSLDVNDFEGSDYQSRPQSKIQRPGSRSKGALGVVDNSSANDSDDSNSVRHQRVSAIQKLRKKQGNLGVEQKSEYSGDEQLSSRQEKEKKVSRRRQKSGILQINKMGNEDEGMDSIQLEKKR